jgi:hypothetical protein
MEEIRIENYLSDKSMVILKNRENDALTLSHVHKIMNMGYLLKM